MEDLVLAHRDNAISIWRYRYYNMKVIVLQYGDIYLLLYS